MKKSNQYVVTNKGRSTKHSRNGCGTCKIRRVKCDESRPTCNRCKAFGVSCEGYGVQAGRSRPQIRKSTPPLVPSGKKGKLQILPRPSDSLFPNEEDKQYFDFFRDQTSSIIVPFYDCDRWRRLALQSSGIPIIHHAIIAMGALHKTSITQKPDGPMVAGSGPKPLDEARAHHRIAISHYGKVIKMLREDADSGNQDLRTTLIASLLVISFETFHGNLDLADAQIQIVLQLICKWKSSYPSRQSQTIAELSPAPNIIEHELLQSFAQLDIQSIAFFDKRRILEICSQAPHADWAIPSVFESLHEAEVCMDIGVIRRHIHATSGTAVTLQPPSGLKIPAANIYEKCFNIYQNTMSWLEQWKEAYDLFLAQSPENCGPTRVLMLRLRYLSISVSLQPYALAGSSADESVLGKMTEIIHISKELLAQATETSWNSSRYTFQLGVIVPLYIVSIQCPLREYRDQAIEILLSRSWREGLWDSRFAGRTAQWIQSLEEEEKMDGYVLPTWARVQMVSPVFDTNRCALVVCHQGMFSLDGSVVLGEKSATITW